MPHITIQRTYYEDSVVGRLIYESEDERFQCWTLELPWKSNERNISCIPEGCYSARIDVSPKNGKVIAIQGVPNRDYIQIHSGNFTSQIEGCILVGDSIKDIDNDSIPDVTNSRRTLRELLSIIPKEVGINISG